MVVEFVEEKVSSGEFHLTTAYFMWLRGMDLNHRPLGYEPNELPDCSTPRRSKHQPIP